MKTNIRIFTAILVMFVAAIVSIAVVSCKKEKHEQALESNEQTVQVADNMDEYLISFKKRLLSAQKGDETISLEQAERDLGNLLNFDFGDANYPTDEYRFDTIHLELVASDDQVDISQLAITYNEAINSILNIYQGIDLPEKSVYAISCQFNGNNLRDNDTGDVEIVLITRGLNNIVYQPHDTLDWRPKNRAGTCDGQQINWKGGPEEMVSWLAKTYEPIACESGGRLYYTNISYWDTDGYKHYDNANERFMIYTSFDNNQNGICIPYEDMEYYYHNILSLYHQHVLAQGHRFTYLSVKHQLKLNCYIPFFDEYRYVYTWHVIIGHGKPNCTDASPITYEYGIHSPDGSVSY